MFELGWDKASGPDGFPLQFFRQFLDTIKSDLWRLCEDFFNGKTDLEIVNWVSLALIPKVETPEALVNYRPISLINSTLKIISKLLASQLSKVMNLLVDVEHSTFLKGR